MLEYLAQNIWTIVITAVIAGVCALIIVNYFRGRKKGKSSCGHGCASCPMNGKCHGH